jgi:hypothetical protein
MDLTIHEVAYHRNGVGGEPFYACHFTDNEEGAEFIATVFQPPPVERDCDLQGEPDWTMIEGYHNPRVAVLRVDLLPAVTFGINSWRGDRYAQDLYHAILEERGQVPA